MKNDKPSVGAIKAAEEINLKLVARDGCKPVIGHTLLIAHIIERETGLKELIESLEFYEDPWEWQKRPENETWLRSDGAANVPDFYDEMEFGEIAAKALSRAKEGTT